MTVKYQADSLIRFATNVLQTNGMQQDMAQDVAEVLVEGDLFGHDTHGLALLKPYVDVLKKGNLKGSGEIDIVSQRAAVASWDGGYLAGPWLVRRGLDWARKVAKEYGTASLVIRRSSHIGALAAFLEQPARWFYGAAHVQRPVGGECRTVWRNRAAGDSEPDELRHTRQ
jgi:L-lactate dehydrogenase